MSFKTLMSAIVAVSMLCMTAPKETNAQVFRSCDAYGNCTTYTRGPLGFRRPVATSQMMTSTPQYSSNSTGGYASAPRYSSNSNGGSGVTVKTIGTNPYVPDEPLYESDERATQLEERLDQLESSIDAATSSMERLTDLSARLTRKLETRDSFMRSRQVPEAVVTRDWGVTPTKVVSDWGVSPVELARVSHRDRVLAASW